MTDIIVNQNQQTIQVSPVVQTVVQAFPAGLKGDKGEKGDSGVPQIIASDGLAVHPNSTTNHSFGYDSSGNLISDTYTDSNSNTYTQTFTWTNGNLTATSNWVKQ
jgi:YD repeat-containing protein